MNTVDPFGDLWPIARNKLLTYQGTCCSKTINWMKIKWTFYDWSKVEGVFCGWSSISTSRLSYKMISAHYSFCVLIVVAVTANDTEGISLILRHPPDNHDPVQPKWYLRFMANIRRQFHGIVRIITTRICHWSHTELLWIEKTPPHKSFS